MSKIITWILVVGMAAVGGYFVLTPQNAPEGSNLAEVAENSDPESSDMSVATEAKKMAFSEFIKNGGAYKCTVSQNVGGVSSDGTVYIDGDKIHGEFNSAINGLNVDSHIIVRDGYTYSWSSMTPNLGFKVKAQAPEEINTGTNTSDTYSFNAQQIGEYDCQPWTAEASKFEIPSKIKFQELGSN